MFSAQTLFLLVASCIFLFACYTILKILFFVRRAISAGKKAIPLSNIFPQARKRILIIGDSTSYGTGATDPKLSLAGRLIQDFPEYEIVNASENGINIKRLYEKLAGLSHERFDMIQIHIGGVDTLSFTRRDTLHTYIQKIYHCAQSMGAEVVVLVSMNNVGALPLFHFPLNRLFDARSERVTKIFQEACQNTTMLHVPLHTHRAHEPLLRDGGKYFSADRLHPNEAGYGIWYEKIKAIIPTHMLK